MCLEKEKQLTRGNEFEIEHIDPQSIPKDLAILIEINISSTLLEVRWYISQVSQVTFSP